ncbi:MAG TPA: class I SAM-dependent methyltransferase [Bacilli bacterium]|nr:class I SAM-dependent methyltransferase [Bacilli bacterium]
MNKDYIELKEWLNQTKDEPLENMAGFFDKRLDEYEKHMSRWKRHYQQFSKLVPAGAETLLDIGCGTGLELDFIFKKNKNLKVTGIDLSKAMLQKLKEKHPHQSLTLINDDYLKCDLGRECFDVVVSFQTLHHFSSEKKIELFKKIYHSLKLGGMYIECDYIASCQEIEGLALTEYQRRRRRDHIPDDVLVHFDIPFTLEHEIESLKNAGFKNIESQFLSGDNHTVLFWVKK